MIVCALKKESEFEETKKSLNKETQKSDRQEMQIIYQSENYKANSGEINDSRSNEYYLTGNRSDLTITEESCKKSKGRAKFLSRHHTNIITSETNKISD